MEQFNRLSDENDDNLSQEEKIEKYNKQKKQKRPALITITSDSRNETITNIERIEFAQGVSPTDYTFIKAGALEGTTRDMLEKIKKRRDIRAPSKSNSQKEQ